MPYSEVRSVVDIARVVSSALAGPPPVLLQVPARERVAP
jgi:hypothetical protein